MIKILFLLLPLYIFANTPDKALLEYQQRYTFCRGHSNYQVTHCLLNGALNYSMFLGDNPPYTKVNQKALHTAEAEENVYSYVMGLLPQTKRYNGLLDYIDYLRSIKEVYQTPKFLGNDAQDIINIKKIFNLLLGAGLVEDAVYTDAFEAALLEYQRRHGLTVDGDIGPQTKKALKTPLHTIIQKVKKNLEIERISLTKGSNYVLINIPEFKMHYYENFEPILDMKVIVGKTKKRTPVFSRNIKYIVKNPRWNIPDNIYNKEYAHKSEEDLRKLGLVYNAAGKLYQPSGRRNALGVVKFLFPNKYNVYMHDTPAKYLFNKRVRTFSHGCIRLEKPLELLNLLGYKYNSRKHTWITLENTIPVYVEYHTVWVDDEGIVQFRNDIYGYERKLFR